MFLFSLTITYLDVSGILFAVMRAEKCNCNHTTWYQIGFEMLQSPSTEDGLFWTADDIEILAFSSCLPPNQIYSEDGGRNYSHGNNLRRVIIPGNIQNPKTDDDFKYENFKSSAYLSYFTEINFPTENSKPIIF